MHEYNELTKNLLAEGYTADNHPKYVEVGRTCQEKDNPIDNLDGGFLYYRWYVHEKAFRTPCGLMCKGTSCMSSLSYNGQEWSFENDMATIHCPYYKCDCKEKDSGLPREGVLKDICNVHMTDEEYQYAGSVEDILKLQEDEIRRKKISFSLQHNGRTCDSHMHYDRDTAQWRMHYDPGTCAMIKCTGRVEDMGMRGICPILGRKLCKEKGNVYYDLKISFRRKDLDNTLFDGQIDTQVMKGIKVFDYPVNMDICRNYVKLCKDKIIWKVESEYHAELFFAERYERNEFAVEVLNIRAEQKESRDLMQDLMDIQNGIKVAHASDIEKSDKATKKKRRQQAQGKKIAKLEKKLLEVGYENLEEYSLDRIHADKWLGKDRIDELEYMRKQKMKEKKPVQMSMFDYLEGIS